MKRIELSKNSKKYKGKYFAIVDEQDFKYLNKFYWYVSKVRCGVYAIRAIELANGVNTVISMHREIMGLKYGDKRTVDHRDKNGLNCRRNNLRIATSSQNNSNRPSKKGSSSKYKGVSLKKWKKKSGEYSIRWGAMINKNKKSFHLGYFKTEIGAALAYNKKAKQLHGEFAVLNIIH